MGGTCLLGAMCHFLLHAWQRRLLFLMGQEVPIHPTVNISSLSCPDRSLYLPVNLLLLSLPQELPLCTMVP